MAPGESVEQRSIPGGWTYQTVELSGRNVDLLLPADPDALLESCEQAAGDRFLADPYWSRLWPTSLAMARCIAARDWSAGLPALELGCGIGLVGLAALVAGLDVTFSDYVPLAVELAVENARRNGFPGVRGIVLDWNDPSADSYPVMIGSDVLYDPKLHESLLAVIDTMLERSGVCLLGDPGRYHVDQFIARAIESGWNVEVFDRFGHALRNLPVAEFVMLELRRTTTS